MAYWKESNKYPYLIWVNKKLAGFVLVQKGSPIDDNPEIWDITEFFLMRKFRQKGIGELVAREIFSPSKDHGKCEYGTIIKWLMLSGILLSLGLPKNL
jgi:predicted acetyltransferase